MAQNDFEERIRQAESGGRRYDKSGKLLTSPKGAEGEMQVMPKTQRDPGFGVTPAKGKNPDEIARVGKDYLAAMEKRYGDKTLAAIAYNMGPGATDKWIASGSDFSKLPAETQGYVQKVMGAAPASRTTKQAATEPASSTQMMEKALKSGMTADLGSGYKAALALAFLGSEDQDLPTTDEELQDRLNTDVEERMAALTPQKPRFNAVSGLDLQALNAAPAQEPVQMSHGGAVHRADGSPKKGEGFGNKRSLSQRIVSGAEGAARDALDAMFPARKIARTAAEPMAKAFRDKMLDAWMERPGYYDSVVKNDAQDDAKRAVFHIRNAARKSLGLEPFEQQVQIDTGRMEENSFPPVPEGVPAPRFADGGDVETPMLFSVPTYAETVSHEMYPGQGGQFDQKDAARHMLAAGTLARKYGPGVAEVLGNLHEIKTSPGKWIGSKLGISEMPVDYEQDLHNNRVGIELAKRSKSQKDLEDLISAEAERAKSQRTPGAAWIGKPVKRSDGSPETGEMGVGFFNPNIQRQGQKARALAAKRDVNTLPDPRTYAAVSGFLGTPPDEQGFSVLHPDLAGIKKAGDIGFGLGLGAAIAPVAGPVAKTVGKMAGSALNERMLSGQSLIPGLNTPAPINFAVKPEQGGFFLTSSRTGSDEVDSFLRHFAGVTKDSNDPLNQWVYKRYSNYMRGPMATEADPFVKGADAGRQFHFLDTEGKPFMPQYSNSVPYVRQTMGLPPGGFSATSRGQGVETAIDAAISPIPVGEVGELNLSPKMKELAAKNPDAPVYEIMMEEMDNVLKPEELRLSLRAMLEDKTLPPEYRITPEQLQKMTLLDASEKAAKFDQYIAAKEGQELLQKSEGLPVYKQYDDGYRWLAPSDVREDERSKRFVLQAGKDARWCTEKESNCLDFASGDSRVLILADPKGRPTVQMNILSVDPEEKVYDWLQTLPYEQSSKLRDDLMLHEIERLPEYRQWLRTQPMEEIDQIKGRFNDNDIAGEALKKAQDVVRSGNWGRVKELENVKLTDADHLYSKEVIDNIIMPKFGTRYLTDAEIEQVRPLLPENKATGGMIERRTADNRRYM